ncbi:ATP-dependent acyl-CoA ligase [soil metagenome]
MSDEVIPDTLRAWALKQPDKPFVKCDSDYFTYARLNERTDELAAGFARLGLVKGDRVAILLSNRIEVLELYFALAKLGVIQVPLNTFLKGEFLRHQLVDSDPTMFIVDNPGLVSSVELLASLPSLTTIVTLDADSEELAADLAATSPYRLLKYESVAMVGARAPELALTPDDLMSILYTSGTTGLPKGCLLTHGYYTRVGRQMVYANETTSDDVLFTTLPLFHSAARMMVVSAALQAGASLVVEPSFSARNFFRRAGEERATLAYGVGAMSVALIKSPPSEFDTKHSLRLVMLPPTPKDLQVEFKERFGVQVWAESFGQTECVPVSNNPTFEKERRPGTSGRPVLDLEVVIMDDEDNPVPQGTAGEVCVRPKQKNAIFAGYWRNPEGTLEAFRHLWFHTGDTGFLDEEGYFHFVDRKKDAIRRRGENVASVELEAAISLHPKIAEVAVIGVPSASTEEDIKACIVLVEGSSFEPEELFDYFAKHLPYYAIPQFVEFLPELPRNATGRIQKFRLKERIGSDGVWDFHAMGHVVAATARR